MPISSQANLSAALIKAAKIFISAAKRFSNYSTRIPRSLKYEQPTSSGKEAKIVIYADPEIAPHAIAKEYGSGLHRLNGTPSTFKIEPKNANALKFPWPKFFSNPPNGPNNHKVISVNPVMGTVALSSVDHPGSEAQPFMDPAARTTQGEIGKIISDEYGKVLDVQIMDIFAKAGFKEI